MAANVLSPCTSESPQKKLSVCLCFMRISISTLAWFWLTPGAGAAPPPPGAAGDRGAGTSASIAANPPPSAAPPASSAAGGDRGAGASPASNAADPPPAGVEAGVASISAPTPCESLVFARVFVCCGSAYLQSMDCQREPQSKHPTGENPGIYTGGVPFLVLFKKTRLIYILYQQTQRGQPLVFKEKSWWPGVGRLAQGADQPITNYIYTT